jgi:hypothetical protein
MNKNNERILLIVIGGLIGFLIGYAIFGSDKLPAENNTAKGAQTATTTTKGTSNSTTTTSSTTTSFTVSAADQSAGKSAMVTVETETPVWVAIREVDDSGNPTNILGAHLFTASGTEAVELLRDMIPNAMYVVSAYEDNGDRIFAYKDGDMQLKGADGSEVLATFKTFPTTPR